MLDETHAAVVMAAIDKHMQPVCDMVKHDLDWQRAWMGRLCKRWLEAADAAERSDADETRLLQEFVWTAARIQEGRAQQIVAYTMRGQAGELLREVIQP